MRIMRFHKQCVKALVVGKKEYVDLTINKALNLCFHKEKIWYMFFLFVLCGIKRSS